MKKGEELQMSVRFPGSLGVLVDGHPVERGGGKEHGGAVNLSQVEMAYSVCPGGS